MLSARVAEWILSLVLPRDRAASAIGDWMEDAAERGPIWFWSSVFRTVFCRIWSDVSASPGFLVSLALRGWLYTGCVFFGTFFLVLFPFLIFVGLGALTGKLIHPLHWHPLPASVTAVIPPLWIGWCKFQTGRWIARRAAGKELAAGIVACIAPTILISLLGLIAAQFWGPGIERYLASHPDQQGSLPETLPTEIFLLAGIIWARHKSLRSIAQ